MRFCHNRKCVSYKSGLSVVKYYRRTGDKVITKEKSFDGGQQEKWLWISLGIVAGILVLGYIGTALYFMSHFLPNTKVNGKDFHMLRKKMWWII